MKEKAILGIETSANICSLALFTEDRIIAERVATEVNTHSLSIAPFAEEIVAEAQKDELEIVAVAVSAGPGSYTGLRIGAAFAKGYAFAKNIPLIAVSTLELLTAAFLEEIHSIEGNALIIPMIDAGRMEVYSAIYNVERMLEEAPQAKIVDSNSYNDILVSVPQYFVGTGAIKCQEFLQRKGRCFKHIEPYASSLRRPAFLYYNSEHFVDVAYWTPEYIKPYNVVVAKNKVLNR